MPDTQKGTWTLQQTRDQILKNCWTYTAPPGGNAFVWGLNCDGQLGLGDRALRSSPTQLPGTWQCISMGTFHAVGIQSNGTLWAWGRNDRGQLGLGDYTRVDKYLAAQNIANMTYVSGNLAKIQYNTATDVNYETLGYTSGNLTSINHYVGSVLKGTTTLSYTAGNLTSAVFVGV